MKRTLWLGPVTMRRVNLVLEHSRLLPSSKIHGAYVSNLLDEYMFHRQEILAAIDQALNYRIADDELLPIDTLDLKNVEVT